MNEANLTPQPPSNEPEPAATDQLPTTPDIAAQVLETIQTVLTAMILAFMFRAFFVEAFVIPTGSMATGLVGDHVTQLCPRCGWQYDYGPHLSSIGEPGVFDPPGFTICPNCHLRTDLENRPVAARSGDRILVHKWPFVLGGWFGPHRWDVIVFRDPGNPMQNYIKRLAALPGETIEIVDGDVFIDGRIARKPPRAQSVLWSVVFDQEHAPVGLGPSLPSPWMADGGGGTSFGWYGLNSRVLRYGGLDSQPRSIRFAPTHSDLYLQDVSGYNHGSSAAFVGDVRISADLVMHAGTGALRIELVREDRRFVAEIRRDGTFALFEGAPAGDSPERLVAEGRSGELRAGRPVSISFGHLDRRAFLAVQSSELECPYDPPLDRLREFVRTTPVSLRMVADAAIMELRSVRIERDVHYTRRPGFTLRALPGVGFSLGDAEYFVLGDNSASSHDSREWSEGSTNLGEDYRPGTVRSDQIVGRAFFVYLPGLVPMDPAGQWRVPDVGRMRVIR